VVEKEWIAEIRSQLPELPRARLKRIEKFYRLSLDDARLIAADLATTQYFEEAVHQAAGIPAKTVANWMIGQIFSWMNNSNEKITEIKVKPDQLVSLLQSLQKEEINQNTAKTILDEMLKTGETAGQIIMEKGYRQVSEASVIKELVTKVLSDNPKPLADYQAGKETLANWFFGQIMRAAHGQANPQVLQEELEKQLQEKKS
jgi:aspartyl-tRNA(Asn)/glutamyl-tRNA(Gln) amidotransferase subunit B